VAILEKEPAALTQLAPQVPADFDWIVGKALRKSPGERYQTTEELGSDLRRLQQKLDLESHHQRVLSEDDAVGKTPGPSTSPRTAGIDPSGRSRVTSRLAAITVSGVLVVAVLAAAWYWRQRHTALHVQAHSLAVLPLKSLDRTEDYLGLGIADAVIRKTSQTGELIVRPISAVRRYMNDETDAVTAGRQQTADVVLEGSVQRAGDRLRVSVNLLRTADGGLFGPTVSTCAWDRPTSSTSRIRSLSRWRRICDSSWIRRSRHGWPGDSRRIRLPTSSTSKACTTSINVCQ